jgi:hypothetical protein
MVVATKGRERERQWSRGDVHLRVTHEVTMARVEEEQQQQLELLLEKLCSEAKGWRGCGEGVKGGGDGVGCLL